MSVSVSPLASVHPARNPDGEPFTAEAMWKLARVGKPAPSPRGDAVVVPVTRYDVESNEARTRLWWVPAAGGTPRALTAEDGSASEPAFSPDGERLVYVRKSSPKAKGQIHLLRLDGGEPEPLTDLPLGTADPRWFPDGKRIAFVAPVLADAPNPEATRKRLEEREKDPVKAHVTEDRVFRFWDRWLTTGEVHHLFVLDLESGELRDLIPDSRRWFDPMEPSGQYDIAPDGSEIVFSANASEPPHQLLRWAIFTVPAAGGPTRCLTADNPADDLRPRYTPDGEAIVHGHQEDPFFYADRVRLVRHERASGETTELLPDWDRSPGGWEIAADGTIVFLAEDRARVKLWRLGPGEAEPRAIVETGSTGKLALGARGRAWFTHETLSDPPEVAWIDLAKGGSPRVVTEFQRDFRETVALGEVQEMEFAGAEGRTVQAFVVLPPGFDRGRKWPLVHVIHGGPHGVSGDGFHFRWNAHLFAEPGYVTVLVNFHGSTSWGQEFAACIQGAHGERPFEDVMRATDAVLATGFVDEKRMAATGASYGGYLISWIAGHTDRFRCLVNHAGVYDTLSQYASDVTQGRHRSYGGEPWDGLERIDRWNPTRFASGFTTPMLVSHGERDYRVPVTQGLEAYGVLKAKGVEARLVYFPDENHWILKPRNSIFWYREVHDWLARFLA